MGPPPGYVAYGGPGAVQGTFQRIGGLTKWLVGLLAVSLVVQLASLLVQFTLRDSATELVKKTISSSNFDDKLGLYLLVAALGAIASVAQIVILIIWTFRLARMPGDGPPATGLQPRRHHRGQHSGRLHAGHLELLHVARALEGSRS